MAVGGFNTLTQEQIGRCHLLGIWVHTGMPMAKDSWFVSRQVDGNLTLMIGKDGEMLKYKTADEAIDDAALNMSTYTWR